MAVDPVLNFGTIHIRPSGSRSAPSAAGGEFPAVPNDCFSAANDAGSALSLIQPPSPSLSRDTEKSHEEKEKPPASIQIPAEKALRHEGENAFYATSSSGSLLMCDTFSSDSPASHTGEINFALRYGVEPSSPSELPRHFRKEDVERYYLTGDPDQSPGLSPKGLELYKSLKNRYISSARRCRHGRPALYLTGGLPGSGKGYVLSHAMTDRPDFVLIDPDEIKKHIIKDLATGNPDLIQEMTADARWGTVVHETSSLMSKMLAQDAFESQKDIVYDSSMATKNVDKYRKLAAGARAHGYKVYGLITQVKVETAEKRALKRAGEPTKIYLGMNDRTISSSISLPGRLTDSSYIRDCNRHLRKNLNSYLKEALYDQCVVYDNSSPIPTIFQSYTRTDNPDGSSVMQCRSGPLLGTVNTGNNSYYSTIEGLSLPEKKGTQS